MYVCVCVSRAGRGINSKAMDKLNRKTAPTILSNTQEEKRNRTRLQASGVHKSRNERKKRETATATETKEKRLREPSPPQGPDLRLKIRVRNQGQAKRPTVGLPCSDPASPLHRKREHLQSRVPPPSLSWSLSASPAVSDVSQWATQLLAEPIL